MLNTKRLFHILSKKIDFVSGVPDSNLKYLINLFDNKKFSHHICINEGAAVSMGIGYYLSTNKMPCIYMQNSGLSNALNPLLSIAHQKVYAIPMLLVIGWRGSPNLKDEPQHNVTGKITRNLLKLAKIKFFAVNRDADLKKLPKLIQFSKKKKFPVAILIKNNFLSKTSVKLKKITKANNLYPTRSDVILELHSQIKKKHI